VDCEYVGITLEESRIDTLIAPGEAFRHVDSGHHDGFQAADGRVQYGVPSLVNHAVIVHPLRLRLGFTDASQC